MIIIITVKWNLIRAYLNKKNISFTSPFKLTAYTYFNQYYRFECKTNICNVIPGSEKKVYDAFFESI